MYIIYLYIQFPLLRPLILLDTYTYAMFLSLFDFREMFYLCFWEIFATPQMQVLYIPIKLYLMYIFFLILGLVLPIIKAKRMIWASTKISGVALHSRLEESTKSIKDQLQILSGRFRQPIGRNWKVSTSKATVGENWVCFWN